ncbi:maleylpyruvate isomerase family mycothiol-dependent enzyme [Agromyces salentinus]|uniref:Mycothiol-dependent maleylpyruvate isomerase metal-binding domain-containing protein n=1 Tax=Agromyces salentinus TaxID=269421 RepID=A0ABP4YN85_9MICO|nr:maleylpyruvate isomerase family mycothiol-dependent enzyme [Agromyces salentinus]
MSDLSRHLPLSNRPRHDESDVSSSWNAELADVLGSLATALAPLPDAAWATTSRRPDWSVHDVIAHLVWRLSTPRGERWRASARSLAEQGFSAAAAELVIARRVAGSPDATPPALVQRLVAMRDVAAARAAGAAPGLALDGTRGDTFQNGIGALAEAVIGATDVAASLGLPLTVPERASGAVALRRALEAPTEIKAVIRGHSLAATDADWSFGNGPVLEATAAELLLFLYGRSDTAPHPRPTTR